MTMRLEILEGGHRRAARLFQWFVLRTSGHAVGDDGKTLMYRPEFFGRRFLDHAHEVLRGPSSWTVAEREYLAAFTSQLNQCPFCSDLHAETTQIETQDGTTLSALDPSTQLRAVLPLLEKVSASPDDVTADDIDAVRAQGVSDEAIVDALYVNAILNTMNRLANAFGWTWNSEEQVRTSAAAISRFRYKLPWPVLR